MRQIFSQGVFIRGNYVPGYIIPYPPFILSPILAAGNIFLIKYFELWADNV